MSRNIDRETAAGPGEACDLRCGCGCLLARVVGASVELKCRRCKRVWRIPVGAPAGDAVPNPEAGGPRTRSPDPRRERLDRGQAP
jgi:hypothetical protein